MKQILWDSEKNATLRRDRAVCFEDVLFALERGDLLDRLVHPNQAKYPGQQLLIVKITDYAYIVPYVETDEYLFLKTIIPSRKATRKYLQPHGDTDEADQR